MNRIFILAAATLLGMALAANDARSVDYPATDFAGNVYPADCRRDLSFIDIPIETVSRYELENVGLLAGTRFGSRVWGAYTWPTPRIRIDEGLRSWMRDEVIHHERCHALMDRLYHRPQWHD